MLDPLSYFTGAAALAGVVHTASGFLVQSAVSGLIGNSFHRAVCDVIPDIRRWRHGQGEPANHHLQRALRKSYLAATRQLLQHVHAESGLKARQAIDEDTPVWCERALAWLKTQMACLEDERYQPPAPPGGWEPAHVVEPAANDASVQVAALRASLLDMLLSEWAAAGLRKPPEAVSRALTRGWNESPTDPDRETDWFDLITFYFKDEVKTQPEVEAIFTASTVSKILIELRKFREEFNAGRPAAPTPFFAPAQPDYFIGREAALKILATRLAEPGAVVPLTGMPGLGKTSLALTFAHRQRNEFEGVYWINCAGQSFAASLAELSSQLGVGLEAPPDEQIREIKRDFAARHCLLVLDNVDSNDLRELIQGGRSAVLVTTRLAGLPFLSRYEAPELSLFTPEECLELFRKHLAAGSVDSREPDYLKLSHQLGRLPLAIAVAAGLLRNDLRYTLPRLLAEVNLHKLKHGEFDISRLLASAIASAGDAAGALLSAMAVCAPSGFRLNLAAEIAGLDLSTALDLLQDLHSRFLVEIVDRAKERYRLHALIRAEADKQTALHQNHAEAIVRRLNSKHEPWQNNIEDLDDWRGAMAWTAGEASRNPALTGLLTDLAFAGFFLTYPRGYMADALRAMTDAAIAFDEAGDRAGLQASYGNQALILQDWGRLDEAMTLLKKQEGICEELGDRAGLQRSYGNQALILQAWGRLDEAMALHEKQEGICRELGLRNSLRISLHNQAILLDQTGQHDEAARLRAESGAINAELMRGSTASA